MPIGFYKGINERLVSVTSFIEYCFGIADEIDKWTLKQSILAVQRASKTKKITQAEAIEIGLNARSQKLDTARIRGTQVHQAIQNLHSNIPYDLEETDKLYYEAYFSFYQQHKIEPILEEFKVTNHQYGYAGRLDFYGKLDGQYVILDFKTSKSTRWTYGLQLACYRKCLEDMGYQVDATYVVHIKPKVRGGVGTAELIEYKYPFEAVKWALGLFNLKLAHDPYVKWYERTDEAAIANEKSANTRLAPESEQGSNPQGLQQETQDNEPNNAVLSMVQLGSEPLSVYQGLVEISNPELIDEALRIGEGWQTIHTDSLRGSPTDEISLQSGVIPLDTQSEGVIHFSTAKLRIVPDPLALPLGSDILPDPQLEWSDEQDNLHTPRQKTA